MRRAARIDNNQPAIVKALKAVGVAAEYIKKPLDLLVQSKFFCPHCKKEIEGGKTELMEVKNPDGFDRLTKEQVEFIARWPGKIHVVRTPEEAIRAVIGEEILK